MTIKQDVNHAPFAALPVPSVEAEVLPDIPRATPETAHVPEIAILTSRHPEVGAQVRVLSQQLHTEVYLERGFIEEQDLNPVGLYDDPYIHRSAYYYVKNGKKVASARLIHADKKKGIMSLPTAKEFSLDASQIAAAADVSSIVDLQSSQVVEISGLASKKIEGEHGGNFDAVVSLYSKMMRDSLEAGHKLWLLNTDKGLLRHLGLLMGKDQVHILGKAKRYMGPPTVPAAISPHAVMREIFGNIDADYSFHIQHLKEIFRDIDARKIPQDIQDMFERHGIEFERSSKYQLSKGEVALQGAVLAYSSARALPAVGIEEFEGSIAALWAIDVGTSVPYAHGLYKMYEGKNKREKAKGAGIAIPAFLAPYAYLYAEGQDYPGYVNGVVGGLIGTAVVKEIVSRKLRARRGRKLTRLLIEDPSPSH